MATDVGTIRAKAEIENRMSGELKKMAGDIQRFQSSFSRVGIAATRAGRALTLGLTAPIIGIGVGAIKAAADFEDSFTGVLKTVDNAGTSLSNLTDIGEKLQEELKDLARELPVTSKEINGVAQAAGQMGIATEDIADFSRVMLELGASTDVGAQEATLALARLANITGIDTVEGFRKMGDEIVNLGNNMATTESEIITFSSRIAGIGAVVGLSSSDIFAFSAALTSVGIPAERGGTAIQKLMTRIFDATKSGGAQLQTFAQVANQTSADFAKSFGEDAAGTTLKFVQGLARMGEAGANVFPVFKELELNNERVKQSLLSITAETDPLAKGLSLVGAAADGALGEEFAKRAATFSSVMTVFKNRVGLVAVELGTALIPAVKDFVSFLERLLPMLLKSVQAFANLPSPIRNTMIAVGLLAAALGPLIWSFGQLAFVMQGVFQVFPILVPRFLKLGGAMKTAGTAAKGAAGGVAALKLSLTPLEKIMGITVASSAAMRKHVALGGVAATTAATQTGHLASAMTNVNLVLKAVLFSAARFIASLLSWPVAIAAAVVAIIHVSGKTDEFITILKNLASVLVSEVSRNIKGTTLLFEGMASAIGGVLVKIKDVLKDDEFLIAIGRAIDALADKTDEWAGKTESASDGAKKWLSQLKIGEGLLLAQTQAFVDSSASIGDLEQGLRGLIRVEEGVTLSTGLSTEQMTLLAEKAIELDKDGLMPLSAGLQRIVEWYKTINGEGEGAFNPSIAGANELSDAMKRLNEQFDALSAKTPSGFANAFKGAGELFSGPAMQLGHDRTMGVDFGFGGAVEPLIPFQVKLEDLGFDLLLGELPAVGKTFGEKLLDGFAGGVAGIGNIITRALTGGGDVVAAIGSSIGAGLGNVIGDKIGGVAADPGAGIAGSLLGGGIGGKIAGGLVSGFAAFGIGTAISAVITGVLSLGRSWEEDASRAGEKMGLRLSDGFIKELKDSGVKDEWAAIMSNLSGAISDSGGVLAVGLDKSIQLTHDLFTFFDRGQISAQTLGTEFGKMFDALLPHAFNEETGDLEESFFRLIALAKEFGVGSEEIAGFMDQIAGHTSDLNKELADLQQQRSDLVVKAGKEGIAALGTFIEATGLKSAGALSTAADMTTRLFTTLLAEGSTASEVLTLMSGNIEAISAAFEKMGIAVPPTFQTLINMAGLFGDTVSGRAITAAQAFSTVMQTLDAISLVTQRDFNMFGNAVDRAFNRAVLGGASAKEAILANAGPISNLIALQEKYGFRVDAVTQDIIDQAKEAGITGETGKSETQKQIAAIDHLIETMGDLIKKFDDLARRISGLPDANVRLNFNPGRFNINDFIPPQYAHLVNIPQAAEGAIVRKGGLVEVHDNELIAPLDQLTTGSGKRGKFGGSLSTGHDDEVHQEIVGLRADLSTLPDILSVAVQSAFVKSRV